MYGSQCLLHHVLLPRAGSCGLVARRREMLELLIARARRLIGPLRLHSPARMHQTVTEGSQKMTPSCGWETTCLRMTETNMTGIASPRMRPISVEAV